MATPEELKVWEQITNILAGIVTGSVAGLAAFWTAFSKSKQHIYGRIDSIEDRMNTLEQDGERRENKLVRLETIQESTENQFENLAKGQDNLNAKLDKLLQLMWDTKRGT